MSDLLYWMYLIVQGVNVLILFVMTFIKLLKGQTTIWVLHFVSVIIYVGVKNQWYAVLLRVIVKNPDE